MIFKELRVGDMNRLTQKVGVTNWRREGEMPIQHDDSLTDFWSHLFQTTPEKIGAIVSVSMIASPIWKDYLQSVSEIAALVAPILGCIYLSMQIGFKLFDRTRNEE